MNIESQEMKFHEWGVGVDPDESCWVESVKFNLSFLVVIRVFYELGPPACEEIGPFICSVLLVQILVYFATKLTVVADPVWL